MLTHRLLVPGVFVLGLLLLVIGLIAIAMGIPIVRMEIGWTEVVGGSVAASAGCVILAMGVLASQLDAIRQGLTFPAPEETFRGDDALLAGTVATEHHATADTIDDAFPEAEPASAPEPEPRRLAHPLAPQRWPPAASAVRPEPPLAVAPADDTEPAERASSDDVEPMRPTLDDGAPSLVHAEEAASHSPAVLPPDRVADPVADLPAPPFTPKPNFLSSFLSRRGVDSAGSVMPGERAPFDAGVASPANEPGRTPIDLSSGWDDEPRPTASDQQGDHAPDHAPSHAPEPEAALEAVPEVNPVPLEPDPLQPVVVGRYNAGSASYVMYSNGMIEVETEQGTHQFGSMQELKNFIEKRDARVS